MLHFPRSCSYTACISLSGILIKIRTSENSLRLLASLVNHSQVHLTICMLSQWVIFFLRGACRCTSCTSISEWWYPVTHRLSEVLQVFDTKKHHFVYSRCVCRCVSVLTKPHICHISPHCPHTSIMVPIYHSGKYQTYECAWISMLALL